MKKPNVKNLLRIATIGSILVVSGYFVLYLVIVEIGKNSHTELIEIVRKEVESDLDYPGNFKNIMSKIHPVDKYIKTKSLFNDRVFATLMGMNHLPRTKYNRPYYSEEVFDIIIIIINKQLRRQQQWTNIFDEKMLFAIGLEDKLSAKEIEQYYFLNKIIDLKVGDEYKRLTGLKAVALERFGKNVEDLQQLELVELFVLMDIYGAFYQEDEEKLKQRVRVHLSTLAKRN